MTSRRKHTITEDASLETTVATDLSFSPDEVSELYTTDDDRLRVVGKSGQVTSYCYWVLLITVMLCMRGSVIASIIACRLCVWSCCEYYYACRQRKSLEQTQSHSWHEKFSSCALNCHRRTWRLRALRPLLSAILLIWNRGLQKQRINDSSCRWHVSIALLIFLLPTLWYLIAIMCRCAIKKLLTHKLDMCVIFW